MSVIVGHGLKTDDPAISRAASLGRGLVTETKARRKYPTQHLYSRTFQVLFLRRAAKRNVIESRKHMEHIYKVLAGKWII